LLSVVECKHEKLCTSTVYNYTFQLFTMQIMQDLNKKHCITYTLLIQTAFKENE